MNIITTGMFKHINAQGRDLSEKALEFSKGNIRKKCRERKLFPLSVPAVFKLAQKSIPEPGVELKECACVEFRRC